MSHKGVDGRGRYSNKVGNSLRNKRRTDRGGRDCKPKRAYKKVPRPSRRLGLATTKSSLILPPPSLGLVPGLRPNRLISIYKKGKQR